MAAVSSTTWSTGTSRRARGWLDPVDLVPILLVDAVILLGVARLLAPEVRHPRRYIRAIFPGGLASILLFVLLRRIRP